MRKYIKPRSVTWWSGAAPLAAGLIVAAANSVAPQLAGLAALVNEMSGGMTAPGLIGYGAAIIGLRGAIAHRDR